MPTLKPNKKGIFENKNGYMAVALGKYYGKIGDIFKITLSSGKILKVVMADEKATKDTYNNCYHKSDGSSIEFIVDTKKAYDYFGGSNGMPLNGNFNNYSDFNGYIVKIEKYNKK